MSFTNIVVDADACPVKSEIVRTANTFEVPVTMVASYDHELPQMDGVTRVQVDRSDQSADLYISNYITTGDVLVTQDIGLASIALAKQAVVISNRGHLIESQSIDFLLENRHISAKERRRGRYAKGPRPLGPEDRKRFQQTLTKVLLFMQENYFK